MKKIAVSGSFDNIGLEDVRFLQEAARFGDLTVILWSDEAATGISGKPPIFPLVEREYLLRAIRYVQQVVIAEDHTNENVLPFTLDFDPDMWVVPESSANEEKRQFCASFGLGYEVVGNAITANLAKPSADIRQISKSRPRVLVTGCYDWFHSGHVRFFEEASQFGELYVALGSDLNVQLLKGEGHPLFPQEVRSYMVQSVRYVHSALISSGNGWLDAEPEMAMIQPDYYVVNEDGDRPEKRAYCEVHGIRYVVLKRQPLPGLPRRESTFLRGF